LSFLSWFLLVRSSCDPGRPGRERSEFELSISMTFNPVESLKVAFLKKVFVWRLSVFKLEGA
jgi:hypothetical protein